jgi:hypothetical protein
MPRSMPFSELFITKSERPNESLDPRSKILSKLGSTHEEFKILVTDILAKTMEGIRGENVKPIEYLATAKLKDKKGKGISNYNKYLKKQRRQDKGQTKKATVALKKAQVKTSVPYTLPCPVSRAHRKTNKKWTTMGRNRDPRTTLELVLRNMPVPLEILIVHSSQNGLSSMASAVAEVSRRAGYHPHNMSYSQFIEDGCFSFQLSNEASFFDGQCNGQLVKESQLFAVLLLGQFDWSPRNLDEQDTKYALLESTAAMQALWRWLRVPVLGRPDLKSDVNCLGELFNLVMLSSQLSTQACPIASMQTRDQAQELGFHNVSSIEPMDVNLSEAGCQMRDYEALVRTGRTELPVLVRMARLCSSFVVFQIGSTWIGAKPWMGQNRRISLRLAKIPAVIEGIFDAWIGQRSDTICQFEFSVDKFDQVGLSGFTNAPVYFNLCSQKLRDIIVDSTLKELGKLRDDSLMWATF